MHEQISTDVRYGAAESRTGENMLVGIQVVLIYDGIKTFRKISQEIKSKVCDNSARNVTKKKEKTIFGSRHPTLYFGIVIIKNINRVAFIVMQDIGTTDYEQISTDVRYGAADSRTRENSLGGIQVVLVCYGLPSVINPEGVSRSGFPKGMSVYHRDASVIVLQ